MCYNNRFTYILHAAFTFFFHSRLHVYTGIIDPEVNEKGYCSKLISSLQNSWRTYYYCCINTPFGPCFCWLMTSIVVLCPQLYSSRTGGCWRQKLCHIIRMLNLIGPVLDLRESLLEFHSKGATAIRSVHWCRLPSFEILFLLSFTISCLPFCSYPFCMIA